MVLGGLVSDLPPRRSRRRRLDGMLRAPVTREQARLAAVRARARGTTVAAVLRAAAVDAGLLDRDERLLPDRDEGGTR